MRVGVSQGSISGELGDSLVESEATELGGDVVDVVVSHGDDFGLGGGCVGGGVLLDEVEQILHPGV